VIQNPVEQREGRLSFNFTQATLPRRIRLFDGVTVSTSPRHVRRKPFGPFLPASLPGPAIVVLISFTVLLWSFPAAARPQQQTDTARTESAGSNGQGTAASSPGRPRAPHLPGSISGLVVDPNGTALGDARVKLTGEDSSSNQETISTDDGRFAFAGVPPGPFRLIIESEGFTPREFSGTLQPGEALAVPQLTLAIAPAIAHISVVPTEVEAAMELKEEEKQRALGFIPNFYVSYVPDAAPLTPKQKFQLAWKSTVDPVNLGIIAVFAGFEQSQNYFSGYGQGAQGFGKRFGAGLADSATGALIGSALLPSILKQDPRYFYKGTGSIRSRILYALANVVICKSDKGRWQANYSGILGGFASAGISNLYYPGKDRGAEFIFENALVGFGGAAVNNLLQEFFVKRFTPNLSKRQSPAAKPSI